MPALQMLAKSLSMIADHHNKGPVVKLASLEEFQQAPDLQIDECDFGIVGSILNAIAENCVMVLIRNMWIVQMNPAQERTLGMIFQPGQSVIHNEIAATAAMQGLIRRGGPGQIVSVALKSPVQSELGIEDERGDECSGFMPPFQQNFRDGGDFAAQAIL